MKLDKWDTDEDFLEDDLFYQLCHQEISEEQRKAIEEADTLKEKVIAVLKTVRDPEIPVNIWDLGLVYEVAIEEAAKITIAMTLTAPGCPVAGIMPAEVERRVSTFMPDVKVIRVNLVWQPPWSREMISEEGRLTLGLL